MFYISAYFEANRDEYYDRLLAVSSDGKWSDWCVFFLKSLKSQAEENSRKASEILSLYNAKKTLLVELMHSQYGILALDWLFDRPIFKSSDFIEHAGIPAPSARRIVQKMRDSGILKVLEEASGRKAGVYAFAELLNIAEGKVLF